MSNPKLTIEKAGRLIATANRFRYTDLQGEWEGAEQISCYYFTHISLSPPIMFEHLSGTGLGNFLNGTSLLEDGNVVNTYLRYVHGKSEAMKGKHTVSAVLLARPDPGNMVEIAWMTYLPSIYKKFLESYGREKKTA